MTAPLLRSELLCQVGIIVNDIVATSKKFCDALGYPAPAIIETPGFDGAKTTLRGAPSEATAKLAFFQTGQIVVELIQPDEKPSVWREFLDDKGEGVHHIAFGVDDTEATAAAFANEGMPAVQQGLYADRSGMYTYLDSAAQMGVMIELLESFGAKAR